MKEYWQKMYDLRTDNDLQQKDIAKILGVRQQQYSRYETGQNELPIRHLITICKYYRVSADWMLNLITDH